MHISERTILASEIKVKTLFDGQWCDGPIWGVCEYSGERYIYYVTNFDEESGKRIYAVVRVEKDFVDKIVSLKWNMGDVSGIDPLDSYDLETIEIIGRFSW